MSGEKLFGAPVSTTSGNTDHEGLKLVLHRYIIDAIEESGKNLLEGCLLYTSPSPRDRQKSRMPSSA